MGNFIKDEKGLRVGFIHHMPFDSQHGMGKTEQELLQIGALVDDIPEPEQIEGKVPVLYYNPQTNSVYYEYVERPLTEEERIALLEQALIELTMLLGGIIDVQ
ncbi:MAG TPA: hypothetical protein V6C99_10740 [Oculatellaceae cyanobacterium]